MGAWASARVSTFNICPLLPLPPPPPLQILHDDNKPGGSGSAGGVSYLEWTDVGGGEGVAALLARAMAQRSVGATAMNAQSSRSHMVFMLAIEGANAGTGQKAKGACIEPVTCVWGRGGGGSNPRAGNPSETQRLE